MKDYKEAYRVYCEAKKEIDEKPFSFEEWLKIEKQVEAEA